MFVGKPPNQGGEPCPCSVMTRAMGHALSLLVVYLGRQQPFDTADFAGHLTNYAAIAAESDPAAGMPLAYWATLLRDIASDLDPETLMDRPSS